MYHHSTTRANDPNSRRLLLKAFEGHSQRVAQVLPILLPFYPLPGYLMTHGIHEDSEFSGFRDANTSLNLSNTSPANL